VVHTIGGMLALAGCIALGPRIGRKFARDGGGMMPGHDMTIAAVGGMILWFGWYGFNPGSTLSALDAAGIGRVATNTTLAASAGGLVAMAWVYPRLKKFDIGITVNGFLAGLVAITCPCYWVSPTGSIVIGAVAAVVCIYGIDLLEHLRYDDPIGAVAVHGFAGIWGTLSLGLFGSGSYGLPGQTGAAALADKGPKYIQHVTGLFYGGGFKQLEAQIIGSATITICALGVGLLLMYLVKATGTLRVSEAGELEGLDIHEHGGPAYRPEFGGVGGYTLPGGGAMVPVPSPNSPAPEPTVAD
jgi:Amt family ammonium transporter